MLKAYLIDISQEILANQARAMIGKHAGHAYLRSLVLCAICLIITGSANYNRRHKPALSQMHSRSTALGYL